MRAVDVIIAKKEGRELTAEEIDFLIDGFTSGEIPDYQMAAWAMAVYFRDMTDAETAALTAALARSGETLDLDRRVPGAVDKHSTGGVGDKTTLVVEPVVAACGVPVAKMSGRGLGHSGGTIDKIESIPGIRTDLHVDEFVAQVRDIGVALIGQTAEVDPADGKLYALRDVTGTVDSIPLIASSIMSKKIAAGAGALLLDVKVGLGAFIERLDDARRLAELMVASQVPGRRVLALLSDMNQPLGRAVGNAIELREAIDTLRDGGPADFREHCLVVAAHLLVLGGKAPDPAAGRRLAEATLADGAAWQRFRRLVEAQGGDLAFVDDPDLLPRAPFVMGVPAPRSGHLARIDARVVGETVVELGGGRARKGDPIDHAVGVEILHEVGDRVEEGAPLFVVHAAAPASGEQAVERVLGAHGWSDGPVEPLPLFYGTVG